MGTEFRALPPLVVAAAWPRLWENRCADGSGSPNKALLVVEGRVLVGWAGGQLRAYHDGAPYEAETFRPLDPNTREPVDWDVVERAAGVEFRPGVPSQELLRAHAARGGVWELRGFRDSTTVGCCVQQGVDGFGGAYLEDLQPAAPSWYHFSSYDDNASWRPVLPGGALVPWATLLPPPSMSLTGVGTEWEDAD